MLNLFGQEIIIIHNLIGELLPILLHLISVMIVASRLQDPLLLHYDLIKFLLHLLLPHFDLEVDAFVLLGLLKGR